MFWIGFGFGFLVCGFLAIGAFSLVCLLADGDPRELL